MEKVGGDPAPNVDYQKSKFDELIDTLPKEKFPSGTLLYHYKGCLCPSSYIKSLMYFGQNYKHKNHDVIISSVPKAGTTWMKALVFSIANRSRYVIDESPLLHKNPHHLMPCIEYMEPDFMDTNLMSPPRLFATHLPYTALPDSVTKFDSRIIYVSRNPLDQFVSYVHFIKQNDMISYLDFNEVNGLEKGSKLPLDEAIKWYSKGLFQPCGPYLDNMLEYWNASKANRDKVLYLRYEELKADTCRWVKEIGEFIGFPFSKEEDEMGLVKEIVRLCSFENLKNLEVNQNGTINGNGKNAIKASSLFRKGQVGDWANNLTLSQASRFQTFVDEKFAHTDLKYFPLLSVANPGNKFSSGSRILE